MIKIWIVIIREGVWFIRSVMYTVHPAKYQHLFSYHPKCDNKSFELHKIYPTSFPERNFILSKIWKRIFARFKFPHRIIKICIITLKIPSIKLSIQYNTILLAYSYFPPICGISYILHARLLFFPLEIINPYLQFIFIHIYWFLPLSSSFPRESHSPFDVYSERFKKESYYKFSWRVRNILAHREINNCHLLLLISFLFSLSGLYFLDVNYVYFFSDIQGGAHKGSKDKMFYNSYVFKKNVIRILSGTVGVKYAISVTGYVNP